MIPFLKGFLNNLNAVQSKQVLRMLSQMRDKGEIRSAKEFETKLVDLANLIQKQKLGQRTPLLTFTEGEILESDAIRTFIDMVRLDLEAALGETERLSNSIRAHNRILTENYFDSLEAALSELEAETRAYEVLESQKFTGFSSVVKRWTFDGPISVPGADMNSPFVSSLFVDSRGGQRLYYSPPNRGENGIHLGIDRSKDEFANSFDRIEILTDSTTPQTALDTSIENNSPIKAIDGSRDTAWRHSILLTQYPDFCRLVIAPSFTGSKRVNALVIEPLSDVTTRIVSVSYVDSGGQEIDLPIGTNYSGTSSSIVEKNGPLGPRLFSKNDWIISNTKKVIPVGDIIARKFIITLQQDTANDGEFFYYDSDLGSWTHDTNMEDVITGLLREKGSPDGVEIPINLGFIGSSDETRRQARFVEYSFGLKEISTITREYTPNGLFVPEPFEMSTAPKVLSLYTDVETPLNEYSDIEFLLRKENYDSNGLLSDVETIPIAPYGTTSVSERLFLIEVQGTSSKDTGYLRFYPDFSSSFNIYKDGNLLTIGTDYEISVDSGGTFETSIPPSGTPSDPKRCSIKIISPQSGVIYSVIYNPLVSASDAGSEVWLNVDHTVRLGRYHTYVFNNQRPTGSIASCKMGLQIILRSNTLNTRVSSYLREAVLLGG